MRTHPNQRVFQLWNFGISAVTRAFFSPLVIYSCVISSRLPLQIRLQAFKGADAVKQPLSCWNVFVVLSTCKENVAQGGCLSSLPVDIPALARSCISPYVAAGRKTMHVLERLMKTTLSITQRGSSDRKAFGAWLIFTWLSVLLGPVFPLDLPQGPVGNS